MKVPGRRGTVAVGGRATRSGRRPGFSDTRDTILGAARTSFGELGFEGTTIRGVAATAGVDPALVHHYFGTKQRLFVTAMQIPVDFPSIVPQLLAGPAEQIGERFVRFVLDLWEGPSMRSLIVGLVRSASTDPTAAAMLRNLLAEGPFLRLATAIARPDAPLRAVLVGSQLIGLAMTRYVVAVEPIASADHETLVHAIGPTIQRYLVGELSTAGELSTDGRAPGTPD